MTTVLLLLGGLGCLLLGAELLVRGASRLAALVGISPLVIGLTVVAFGTSAPELAVSVRSALSGGADVAVGNVVGSNIFNILLILGISALITPLAVTSKLCRIDVPLMVGCSLLVFLLALDGRLGRLEGALLFLGIVAYTGFAILAGRREKPEVQEEYADAFGTTRRRERPALMNTLLVLAGLLLLVVGADWLVDGAIAVARLLGASELLIGLTIVATGTSLPEVATSIVASVRGERDIAVGNVVGSNIFNLLAVLGASALAAPSGIAFSDQALQRELPVMIAVALACLPVFLTGGKISRGEGLYFLLAYAAYLTYQIMLAQQPGPAAAPGMAFYAVLGAFALLPLLPALLPRRARNS